MAWLQRQRQGVNLSTGCSAGVFGNKETEPDAPAAPASVARSLRTGPFWGTGVHAAHIQWLCPAKGSKSLPVPVAPAASVAGIPRPQWRRPGLAAGAGTSVPLGTAAPLLVEMPRNGLGGFPAGLVWTGTLPAGINVHKELIMPILSLAPQTPCCQWARSRPAPALTGAAVWSRRNRCRLCRSASSAAQKRPKGTPPETTGAAGGDILADRRQSKTRVSLLPAMICRHALAGHRYVRNNRY